MILITKRCSYAFLSLGIALGFVLGGVSQAKADYRVELDGSYAEGDDPFGDIDNLILSVEAFLAPVDDSRGPYSCLLYTSPSPRDLSTSRMPSSA